jgi:hypothetical protein
VGFRLHTFDEPGYTRNPFLLEVPFIVWTQSEMAYSLISATIPVFQNFLRNLNTGFGGIGATGGGYGYGYGSGNNSRVPKGSNMSYQMSKLRSADKSVDIEEPEENRDHVLTNGHGANNAPHALTTSRDAANGETTSIGSDESRRMMIRKEVQWSVRRETDQ